MTTNKALRGLHSVAKKPEPPVVKPKSPTIRLNGEEIDYRQHWLHVHYWKVLTRKPYTSRYDLVSKDGNNLLVHAVDQDISDIRWAITSMYKCDGCLPKLFLVDRIADTFEDLTVGYKTN